MKRLTAGLLLAAASASSFASNWVQVTAAPNFKIFVDGSSMLLAKNSVKAWVLYDNTYPQIAPGTFNEKTYVSEKSLEYFDCDDRTSATAQAVYSTGHGGSGVIVASFATQEGALKYLDVVPDSAGEATYTFICSMRPKKPSTPSAIR